MNSRWILLLALLMGSHGLYALDSKRFLERLDSEQRGDKTVITVHLTQTMQYLSHSANTQGKQVNIKLRRNGPIVGNLINGAIGPGVKILKPAPGELPQLQSITASGDLDADPGLIVNFSEFVSFEIRPGPDTRSINIELEKSASHAPVISNDALEQANFTSTTTEEKRLQVLFREARKALKIENYRRATAIYDKIIASGIEPYKQEAILALGVTRAQNKQFTQARAQFELYLDQYPESDKADKVKQRLDALLLQQESSSDTTANSETPAMDNWQHFGTFDQFYLQDGGEVDNRGNETYRSSLLTSANLSLQGRTGNLSIGGRFSGSYDYSFLDERDSPTRVSYMYLDLANPDGKHKGRLGRQRLSGSGVLGYFDGLHYQYKLTDQYSLRYAGGSPVQSTREGIDTDNVFHGLAVDYHPLDNSWFISLYGLERMVKGDTDRRALGSEIRYMGGTYSLYSLLDYDLYFDELNIFHLFGNWQISTATTASFTLEYRRSPSLALSNALQGQTTNSLDGLQIDYSSDELEQLALTRSLVYKSVYLSLTQQLTDQWQAMIDAGSYSLSTDTNRLTVDEEAFESEDWYVYTQLMGSSLVKQGDLYSAGLRYTNSSNMDITSLLFRARIPAGERWRLTPRLRLDYRDRGKDETQWQITPSFFSTYRLSRKTSLEFNIGLEFKQIDDQLNGTNPDEQYYFISLGYRRDF